MDKVSNYKMFTIQCTLSNVSMTLSAPTLAIFLNLVRWCFGLAVMMFGRVSAGISDHLFGLITLVPTPTQPHTLSGIRNDKIL